MPPGQPELGGVAERKIEIFDQPQSVLDRPNPVPDAGSGAWPAD
jgi:hypothetical protein